VNTLKFITGLVAAFLIATPAYAQWQSEIDGTYHVEIQCGRIDVNPWPYLDNDTGKIVYTTQLACILDKHETTAFYYCDKSSLRDYGAVCFVGKSLILELYQGRLIRPIW
jgi:hypothetical protein